MKLSKILIAILLLLSIAQLFESQKRRSFRSAARSSTAFRPSRSRSSFGLSSSRSSFRPSRSSSIFRPSRSYIRTRPTYYYSSGYGHSHIYNFNLSLDYFANIIKFVVNVCLLVVGLCCFANKVQLTRPFCSTIGFFTGLQIAELFLVTIIYKYTEITFNIDIMWLFVCLPIAFFIKLAAGANAPMAYACLGYCSFLSFFWIFNSFDNFLNSAGVNKEYPLMMSLLPHALGCFGVIIGLIGVSIAKSRDNLSIKSVLSVLAGACLTGMCTVEIFKFFFDSINTATYIGLGMYVFILICGILASCGNGRFSHQIRTDPYSCEMPRKPVQRTKPIGQRASNGPGPQGQNLGAGVNMMNQPVGTSPVPVGHIQPLTGEIVGVQAQTNSMVAANPPMIGGPPMHRPGSVTYENSGQYQVQPDQMQYQVQPGQMQYQVQPGQMQYQVQPGQMQYQVQPGQTQYQVQPDQMQMPKLPEGHHLQGPQLQGNFGGEFQVQGIPDIGVQGQQD